jgi:hypothetical protein
LKDEIRELKADMKNKKKQHNENHRVAVTKCENDAKSEYNKNEKEAIHNKEQDILKCKDMSVKERKICKDKVSKSFKNAKEALMTTKRRQLQECKNIITLMGMMI